MILIPANSTLSFMLTNSVSLLGPMEDTCESDRPPAHSTSEKHSNMVHMPADKPTYTRKVPFFFYNLVSDFTVTLVCPPWSSFPYKHILVRFLSSPTALHSIHILVAPIPISSILTTLLNSIPGYSTA